MCIGAPGRHRYGPTSRPPPEPASDYWLGGTEHSYAFQHGLRSPPYVGYMAGDDGSGRADATKNAECWAILNGTSDIKISKTRGPAAFAEGGVQSILFENTRASSSVR